MIRNDYIMRLVELVGVFLARLANKIGRGELEEATEEVGGFALESTGIPLAVLESSPPDKVEALLTGPFGPDHAKLFAAGVALDVRGRIAHREGDEIRAHRFWVNAAFLYLAASRSPDKEVRLRSREQLEDNLTRLREFDLPGELHLALGRHFEEAGEYGRAEDHFFEAKEEGFGEDLKRFYERLLNCSDSELEAGNLSREELLQGLSELG